MKRFQFRLARVERWRRQRAQEYLREHEFAVQVAAEARTLLAEHDALERAFFDDMTLQRETAGVDIEMMVEWEKYRNNLKTLRQDLVARERTAAGAAGRTLERLIEARRELKALESLRSTRFSAWQREANADMQKQADESHRSRLLLEKAARDASERQAQEPALGEVRAYQGRGFALERSDGWFRNEWTEPVEAKSGFQEITGADRGTVVSSHFETSGTRTRR